MECSSKKHINKLTMCYVSYIIVSSLIFAYAIWGIHLSHEILLRVQIEQSETWSRNMKLLKRVAELEKIVSGVKDE